MSAQKANIWILLDTLAGGNDKYLQKFPTYLSSGRCKYGYT